jgi:hypothetical protein
MNLEIEIVSGKRAGTRLSLHPIASVQLEPIIILEDEAIRFHVLLDEYYENLVLALHENEVPYSRCVMQGKQYLYEWFPREINSRKEPFFHNYYGTAELVLISKKNAGLVIVQQYQSIEILAKKINAERVDNMLAFLASHDSEVLARFFRVTRIRAGFKAGEKSDTFLIEQLERNATFLSSVLPAICSNPLISLHQQSQLIVPNEHTLVDENTLSWFSENTDSLYQVGSQQNAILDINGDFYSASKVLETHLVEQTDVYENRVLHGFVSILAHTAKDISKRLGQPPIEIRSHVTVDGYLSFFSQIKKFWLTINKSKIERCKCLVKKFESFAEILRRRLPVKSSFKGVPQFTQKAKQNIHYQNIFHRMITWHRFGVPDWSLQEELFSIKNIPKLFEYYLLFLVKDHFDKLSSIQGMTIFKATDAANGNEFEYAWGRLQLRIMYEPKIWLHGHDEAHSQVLINSEGYTAERDGSGRLTGNFHRRSSKSAYSNRSPDILISLSDSQGNRVYFIVD